MCKVGVSYFIVEPQSSPFGAGISLVPPLKFVMQLDLIVFDL